MVVYPAFGGGWTGSGPERYGARVRAEVERLPAREGKRSERSPVEASKLPDNREGRSRLVRPRYGRPGDEVHAGRIIASRNHLDMHSLLTISTAIVA